MLDFDSLVKPPAPPRTLLQRIFRVGFPQVVIVLAVFLCIATSIGSGHHIERQWFSLFRFCIVAVGLLLLGIWAVFLSGWRRLPAAFIVLAIAGGAWAAFRVEFDGDLNPSIHARDWVLRQFGASHDDLVESHRKQQSAAGRPIDLTPHLSDWPGYRGLDRTGTTTGPVISRDWSTRPPRIVWKHPTYGGYASFAVVNGFLFTLEQRRNDEAVVCYDASDGTELWTHPWPAKFTEAMGGPGPRTTPTVDGGEVFALGALGRLVCLNGKTGQLKWAVETLQGKKNLTWGMSGSPLVYGNLVVVNPGSQGAKVPGSSIVAYDRSDGHVIWVAGKSQAGYSSPMLARLDGRWQVLVFDGAGLGGYDPDSGEDLWRFPWATQGSDGINVAQPVILEKELLPPIGLGSVAGSMALTPIVSRKGELFIASAYGRGGALLQVEKGPGSWEVRELWRTSRTSMRCKVSSPVEYGGYLFGLDDGNLECIDSRSGERQWKDERNAGEGKAYGQGQILLHNDLLVILTHYGEVVLVEARPDRFNELGRMKVLQGDKTWNNPAIVAGRLYIRNHLEMACVDLR